MLDNVSSPCHPLSPFAEVQGYRPAFAFELLVRPSLSSWWSHNWTMCFTLAALYLVAILGGQLLMRSRPAFSLRRPLLTWNFFIASYSLFTCSRVATEIGLHVRHHGFVASICDLGPVEHQQILGFYLLTFALSKVVELGDTVFLVLQKKPVPLLHCFHHAMVMVVTWAYTAYPSVVGAYFMAMNQAVHVCLYSYLWLKMLKVSMPRAVVTLLAILELLQVVIGFGLTLLAALAERYGKPCCLYAETKNMIFAAYVAFAVVFTRFLASVVLSRRARQKSKNV